MKIMHTGDLHLGRSLREFSLIDDQKFILDQMLDLIRENDVRILLIAGDVFDKTIPSEAAVNLLDDFLSKLADMSVETFIISGNHDSNDRLAYGSRLFSQRGIHIAARYDGSLECVKVKDEQGDINIWMLPFVRTSHVKYYHPDAKIETYDDAIRTVIESAGIDPAERNILIAHQFVTGKTSPRLSGSESAGVQNVGTVDMIRYSLFNDFDYVALGHIHGSQPVGRETVRYSGSPLKYSLRETGTADEEVKKYVTVFSAGAKEDGIIPEEIPLKPMRDLRHLRGKLAELLDPAAVRDPQDYVYITLTDEGYIENASGIIRQVYPRYIGHDYDNSHSLSGELTELTDHTDEKTFDELISDFYRLMYGTEMSDEEMAVMKAIARKAGVVVEAD